MKEQTSSMKNAIGHIELSAGQHLKVTKKVMYGPHHDKQEWGVGSVCKFAGISIREDGEVHAFVVDEATKTPLPFDAYLLSEHFVKVTYPEAIDFVE